MSRLKDKMRLEFEAEVFPQRAPRNRDCWIRDWCDVANNTTSWAALVLLPTWSTHYRRSHATREHHVSEAYLLLDMYLIVDANDQTTSFITIRLGHRQSANVLSPEKQ